MGLLLAEYLTPHGISLTGAYVCIDKQMGNLTVFEVQNDFKITAPYRIYKDEESRRSGLQCLLYSFVEATISKEELGNPYTHLYNTLKERYPNYSDCL